MIWGRHGVEVANTAKYLGMWMGPGREAKIWEEAIAKFLKSARRWPCGSWGLALAALLEI